MNLEKILAILVILFVAIAVALILICIIFSLPRPWLFVGLILGLTAIAIHLVWRPKLID